MKNFILNNFIKKDEFNFLFFLSFFLNIDRRNLSDTDIIKEIHKKFALSDDCFSRNIFEKSFITLDLNDIKYCFFKSNIKVILYEDSIEFNLNGLTTTIDVINVELENITFFDNKLVDFLFLKNNNLKNIGKNEVLIDFIKKHKISKNIECF